MPALRTRRPPPLLGVSSEQQERGVPPPPLAAGAGQTRLRRFSHPRPGEQGMGESLKRDLGAEHP